MLARSDGAIALVQTMLGLRAERRTGVLDVRGGDVHTLIDFREGALVFAEDAAVVGALNPQLPQVERARREQARAAVARSLLRDGSWWSFDDSPDRKRPESSFLLDLESIVLEVMRQLPTERKVADVFSEGMEQGVRLVGDPSELATRFDLTPPELFFLQKLGGRKTVRDLLGGAHPIDVSALLGTLVVFEAAVLSPAPAAHELPLGAGQAFERGLAAMTAGDEVAAKKYFYEALRLDPESPAKQQVRLLALRTTPPPPVVEVLEEVEPEPEEPAPEVEEPKVEEPKVDALKVEEPAVEEPDEPEVDHGPRSRPTPPPRSATPAIEQAPPRSKTGLIAVAIVLAGVAAIIAITTQSPSPTVPGAPTPSPIRPQPVAAVVLTPTAPLPAASSVLAEAPPPEKTPVKSNMGNVQLPAAAAGHRVFVDGRVQKDGSMLLVLPCGAHVIQIGSHGTQKSIDVLCGREIRLE
ncbi:MAG: DUF4388 domain-containing protein [Polyangiaceae bacterium]